MDQVALSEGASNIANVATAITSAVSDVAPQAISVITAAVGLGVVFWGARLLWNKFKSMAKQDNRV